MSDALTEALPGTRHSNWTSIRRHTILCCVSFIMLYPLLWMVSASLKPADEILNTVSIIPSRINLSAYPRGWFGLDVSFGTFFLNSLIVSILSVVGNVISCSLAAFAFARLQFPGRNLAFSVMLGTLMLPYHVVLIPQYILFLNLGWIDTFLPLVVPKFLACDSFFIFLMVQFFRGIPRELDEAARVDGCSAWRIYYKIMLPLSLPVLGTAAIFSFIFTWDDFFAPLIYLGDPAKYTAQVALRTFIDSSNQSDWGGLFAMSTLALIPVFIFFVLFQRVLIDGIATTGMKR